MSWTAQKINNLFNPHPTLWLGVLELNISKSLMNELPRKLFHFKPLTPTHSGGAVLGDGGREGGATEGVREGWIEVRREGTRAKPGNQLVYYICIHLLDPHWNMHRLSGSVISTQQHKFSH